MRTITRLFCLATLLVLLLFISNAQTGVVWSKEKANEWYQLQDWPRGCNFIPSTAINQLEMWQAESFDTTTISRELGYAESIGFNTVRVFLHHAAWQQDSSGFKNRVNQYLDIANRHNISTIFVFFDDCWNATYTPGKQPEPKKGVHNSGWVRDPGTVLHENPKELYPILERYVKDMLSSFKDDKRILLWDLYNEPGNSAQGAKTLPLLKKVFEWAEAKHPTQPVTAGIYTKAYPRLRSYQLNHSDVITYHSYGTPKVHLATIKSLKKIGRPMICTEYMARTVGSTFFNSLPLLKENNVGAINWGLVSGKTNTIYSWFVRMPSGDEPKVWFHDIFRKNGEPYDKKEVDFIKSVTGK